MSIVANDDTYCDDGDDDDDDDDNNKEISSYPPSTTQVALTLRPTLVGCLKATTCRVVRWRCGCASFV